MFPVNAGCLFAFIFWNKSPVNACVFCSCNSFLLFISAIFFADEANIILGSIKPINAIGINVAAANRHASIFLYAFCTSFVPSFFKSSIISLETLPSNFLML